MTINNSTLTGNTASSSGGGIYLYGSTVNLVSTIVANNVGGGSPDIGIGETGTVNATNSLIRSTSGFSFSTNLNNITGQDPLLGPLANNGGPTLTHALLGGSPAIDAGSNPLALAFDQRGTPFVRSSGVTDIGAYRGPGCAATAAGRIHAGADAVAMESGAALRDDGRMGDAHRLRQAATKIAGFRVPQRAARATPAARCILCAIASATKMSARRITQFNQPLCPTSLTIAS